MSVSGSSSISVSPFESSEKPIISAGLYLHTLCQKLKMPDEHSVCIMVLINRLCNMSQKQFARIYNRSGGMYGNQLNAVNNSSNNVGNISKLSIV